MNTELFSLVGSLGFPIVVAMYMIYVNQKQQEQHTSEIKEMTTALTQLKLVIQQLSDKLGNEVDI